MMPFSRRHTQPVPAAQAATVPAAAGPYPVGSAASVGARRGSADRRQPGAASRAQGTRAQSLRRALDGILAHVPFLGRRVAARQAAEARMRFAAPDFTPPTPDQLRAELGREKYRTRYGRVLRSTVYALVTVAAVAVLVATLWLPVLQIYGSSMTPTLTDGDVVVTVKTSDFEQGDVIAFYYNNKILIKRVIAEAGDWVDIDEDGTVYVNGAALDEPYVFEPSLGECDITLPYQVPDGRVFVMGDHRSTSVDSRSTSVGCVAQEQVVGKVTFCVWPLARLGAVE